MDDLSLRLSPPDHPNHKQFRRSGWIKLALGLLIMMLIMGVVMAGSVNGNLQTAAQAGLALSANARTWLGTPRFQFTGQGQILGGGGKVWLISGVPVQVDSHTHIIGELSAGDFVTLSGRILDSGVWLADRISQADVEQPVFTFNDVLLSISADGWRIGSSTLAVNDQSELDAELAVNDPALATFTPLENGVWLALKIEPFDKPWVDPTPIPAKSPNNTPGVTQEPQTGNSQSNNNQNGSQEKPSKVKEDKPGKGKSNHPPKVKGGKPGKGKSNHPRKPPKR